jgi:Arylmalonate decarboxylase
MRKDFTIGLVVPFATDMVPDEGLKMYPGVRFVARGVGVRSLTPTGYEARGKESCRRPNISPGSASTPSW